MPGRGAVEIGCGEGRVSRDLTARGHRVVGVDTAAALLVYARQDGLANLARADGAALPFADESFDLAVAYNSLQVVADMPGTVSESARVLSTGGHFCFCVSHPVTDVGRFDGDGGEASFMFRDDYFANRRVDDSVQRNGLKMRSLGWTHSLEDYGMALERAGLKLEAIREPRPSDGPPGYERWRRVPLFLMARSVKG
jgi:SAM-dependent methyltransferase